MHANLKHWRESASLIALARSNLARDKKPHAYNYEILFQKRSDKSGFMPSRIVFPGGAIESCDSDWFNHFRSFGITDDKFNDFQMPNASVSQIFHHESNPNLRHVALRITAIRETFEELGILICKNRHNISSSNNSSATSFLTDFDIQHWQKKVHKDPLEFLSLCQSLDCYPDIWSLHLWSNWLTPVKVNPRRFNAVFFITFFDNKPPVHIDGKEVSQCWWSSPGKVLEAFKDNQLILATPQWYELCRLERHSDMDQLEKFAVARSRYGCELFYPIYQKVKDGIIVILPGDELYPKNPDLLSNTDLLTGDKTIRDLRESSKVIHRIIYHDPQTLSCDIKNYIPAYNHLSPAMENIPLLKQKL